MKATKCITQKIPPNQDLDYAMNIFKEMMNRSIRIGIKHNATKLKKLSLLAYHELDCKDLITSYKLNAMSQACGILTKYKKLLREGKTPKSPKVEKPFLVNCYGFKINGCLLSIPLQTTTANQHSSK